MNASYHMVRPVEADLCRGCRLATFQALPVGQAAVVAIFCRRLDCDNVETTPLEPLPDTALHCAPVRDTGRSILRRAWASFADSLRRVW